MVNTLISQVVSAWTDSRINVFSHLRFVLHCCPNCHTSFCGHLIATIMMGRNTSQVCFPPVIIRFAKPWLSHPQGLTITAPRAGDSLQSNSVRDRAGSCSASLITSKLTKATSPMPLKISEAAEIRIFISSSPAL